MADQFTGTSNFGQGKVTVMPDNEEYIGNPGQPDRAIIPDPLDEANAKDGESAEETEDDENTEEPADAGHTDDSGREGVTF